MAAYLIVDLRYEELAWAKAYRRHVPQMIAAWGGRYLAQGMPPERLEGQGELPDSLTLLEFPNAETVRRFLASPEYAPYARERQEQTRSTIYLLES